MANSNPIIFSDIDVYGRTDASGIVLEFTQDNAISNALVAWFSSHVGEYIYQPAIGGILDLLKFKLMTTDQTNELTDLFTQTITANFGGVLTLNQITVFPDLTTRTYKIEISYTSTLTNTVNLVQFTINPPVSQSLVPTFIQVPYIGQNLVNFTLIKLPDFPGVRMVQDTTTGLWTWGTYQFINLVDTDPYFQTVFDLIKNN